MRRVSGGAPVAVAVAALAALVALPGCAAGSRTVLARPVARVAIREPATPVTTAMPGAVGMNFGTAEQATVTAMSASGQRTLFASMVADGVRWLRWIEPFADAEPRPGLFIWAGDAPLASATAAGLTIDVLILAPPAWATAGDGTPVVGAVARFSGAVASHLAPLGIRDYEIWNEPNTPQPWGRAYAPAAFARLVRAATVAVHAAQRGSVVVTGGLAPAPDTADGRSYEPVTYLRDLYRAGLAGGFDALGLHPYSLPDTPAQIRDAYNPFSYLAALRALMVAHGDSSRRIWFTEYGAPVDGPHAVTEALQAESLDQAFALARARSWIGPVMVFDWRDDRDDGAWGVLRADGSPRPALAVLTWASGPVDLDQ